MAAAFTPGEDSSGLFRLTSVSAGERVKVRKSEQVDRDTHEQSWLNAYWYRYVWGIAPVINAARRVDEKR
jgi:hypothetical protein